MSFIVQSASNLNTYYTLGYTIFKIKRGRTGWCGKFLSELCRISPPDLNLVQALPVDPGLPAAPLLSARPYIALGLLCVFGNSNFYGSAWPIFQIDSESQWE
jgi:hypothetical protein